MVNAMVANFEISNFEFIHGLQGLKLTEDKFRPFVGIVNNYFDLFFGG